MKPPALTACYRFVQARQVRPGDHVRLLKARSVVLRAKALFEEPAAEEAAVAAAAADSPSAASEPKGAAAATTASDAAARPKRGRKDNGAGVGI